MFIGHINRSSSFPMVHLLAQVTCIKGGLSASYSSCAVACQEAQKRKPLGVALLMKASLQ